MLGNGKAEFDWPCDAWQRQGTAVQSKGYEVNCCAVALRSKVTLNELVVYDEEGKEKENTSA